MVGNNNRNDYNSNRGKRRQMYIWQTLNPESAQAAIQRLFDASIELEDPEFHVVGPLCKLSLEMVSMQSGTHVSWSPD